MSLDNDRSFGKYKLVAELGSGGYGVVYQARDTTLQRTVALKLLRPQLTADPGFVQQFYHEAQLVAQLDHPNVVTVYDVGEEEGQHFIVMQYVEGRSLAEGLTRGESWPPERILPLAEQLAAALDYAHAQGVLHLDVKPGNVLLGDEDQVWLTDFGLGRAVSSATQPSSALAGGTPAYLAPEQADLEEPRPVTAAADIYGFGVLLYRLCTGRVPFEGKPTAVTTAHVNQQPPRPTLLNDALNQAVEDVLLRALAKSPQARFPDVAGLVDALAEAARKDEGRARPARVVTVEPLKLGDFRVRTLRELAQACDNAWEEAVERLCDGTLEAWLQEARLLGAAEEAKRLREAWAGAEGRERERALEEFLEWTGYVTDPVLRVTPEVLDLGEVEKGYGHRVPTVLTLQNVGRGMLWGEVMSRVAWLSVSGDPHFLIRAGERREVPVEAEVDVLPSGRTDVVEGLIVRTPVGETQVGVQVAVLGPEIHVEPPELHLGKITEGETPVRRVTVGNQGRGALQGSVRSEDPWLTVTPERFRCTAGQRTRLTVTADTKQIVEVFRELHGTITLDTNETSVAIPVRLVNPNPESVSLFLTSMISVNSVAFSPDGSILASGSDDTTVWLWDATDGMLLRTLEGHTNGVNSVAFSPDGTTLASGGNDETVRLWDVQSGQCLQTLKGHSDRVRSVTFSPDGNILASASDDRTVQLWASRSGRLLQTIKGHKGWVNSVAFCPDGNILASGSGRTVRLWDVQSGQCLQTLKGHSDRVRSVAFSPDGTTLASGSKDRTIRLWDVQNGQGLQTLESHNDRVRSVTFSPDGVTLASGADDRTVRLWDVQSGQCIQRLKGHLKGVSSVAFNLDGSILASGSEDDTVRLWDVQSSRLLQTLLGEGHTDSVSSVAFSPDSRILASGSNDTTVRLWNAADGTLLRTLEGHTGSVNSVAFSPDGGTLASGSGDGTVQLWNTADGSLLRTLEGYTRWVTSVAFSPDGGTLASGSDDGTVQLWDAADGTLLRTLEGRWVSSVAFSPDSRILASGSNDTTVRLWDVSDGSLLRTLEGHTDHVRSVAFSPDGTTLASGSTDRTIRLWDVQNGQGLQTLESHNDRVESVAFSPDGRILASGSNDTTVRLWNAADGTLLRTLEGHTDWVLSVAFSPDGSILASISLDGPVRLWRVDIVPPSSATEDTDDFPEKRVRIALIAVSILIVVAAGIAIQDGAGAAQFLGLLLLVVGVTIFTWAVLGWFILRRR